MILLYKIKLRVRLRKYGGGARTPRMWDKKGRLPPSGVLIGIVTFNDYDFLNFWFYFIMPPSDKIPTSMGQFSTYAPTLKL